MAVEAKTVKSPAAVRPPDEFRPYISDQQFVDEFTARAVILGAVLGIVFGASSLYLVLKVGLTVSASIPVAVLSITLFRLFSKLTGLRRGTILENNITQTAGSAGESIAFGVGVTMPALMLLGFEMDVVRVMTVGALGGLLGILMMIPLRRAFIVKQHKELKYPEGTACAEVLIVGEEGGATAATVFGGFGLAFLYKLLYSGLGLWPGALHQKLFTASGKGLKGGILSGEISPELLGVGYIIGPRIASIMLGGGVLAYLVLTPLVVLLGQNLETPIAPATQLIRDMDPGAIRSNYILYIGAGAVATGGIISMFQAMPLILASIGAGLRDLRGARAAGGETTGRTSRDLSMLVVLVGSVALVFALAALPNLGLGLNWHGLLGAALIVFFGFLFVTVSARLTGQIGSSSNPISGMTVATLLLTCLVFLALGKIDKASTLTALTIAAVVCVAASNGGTTAQDLKTGYLVGATPRWQQLAILVGALTSALVIGVTLLLLNEAGTVYTTKPEYLPNYTVPDVSKLPRAHVGGEYAAKDTTLYYVFNVSAEEAKKIEGVRQGKYLVDQQGTIRYYVDPAINGTLAERDDKAKVTKFDAPKTRLMALIIDGILNQVLPWELVLIGALIAITLELAGVPSLPFAVGVYLPLETSAPIFVGGAVRWLVDKLARRTDTESDSSPGVLLSSGYIAGGAIAGVVVAFFAFLPDKQQRALQLGTDWTRFLHPDHGHELFALAAFGLLVATLFVVGMGWIMSGKKMGK